MTCNYRDGTLRITPMGFTKLHGTIIHSSIWQESAETRVVWVTMLAMADATGTVYASVSGLARAANVNREDCGRALECFLGPDAESSDGTTGERIKVVPGGWFILNHGNYRDRQTREQELSAKRSQGYRDRQRVTGHGENDSNVTAVGPSASASFGTAGSVSAPRLPDSGSEGVRTPERKGALRHPLDSNWFNQFWNAFDKKRSKVTAEKAWIKISPNAGLAGAIILAADTYAASTPDKHFRKDPTTWLNQRCWEDEVVEKGKVSTAAHVPNMPLGAPSCSCPNCVAFRAKHQTVNPNP